MKRLAMLAILAGMAATPVALVATAHATTINCQHIGPIVGHPGMEYVCYVIHDNAPREIFYAPGPRVP
jgi:hypothetical protein